MVEQPRTVVSVERSANTTVPGAVSQRRALIPRCRPSGTPERPVLARPQPAPIAPRSTPLQRIPYDQLRAPGIPRDPVDWEFFREGIPREGSGGAWWPDPSAYGQLRWWDGSNWTPYAFVDLGRSSRVITDPAGMERARRWIGPTGTEPGVPEDHWAKPVTCRRALRRAAVTGGWYLVAATSLLGLIAVTL